MLYQIDDICVKLEDVIDNEDKSYEWIFDRTERMNMENIDIVEEFFSKRIKRHEDMYSYECSCVWGEASRNYRLRFMIIEVEDDYVLVPLKVVDPRGAKERNYFVISYPPISYMMKEESIDNVLNALREYKRIKYRTELSCEGEDYFDINYYNIKDDFKNINKSRWRSKNGVSRLYNMIDISTQDETIPYITEELREVIRLWNKAKKYDVSDKPDIKLMEIAMRSERIIPITFRYKGKLIAYTILSKGMGKYLFTDVNKSLSVCSDDVMIEYIGEKDESIIQYIRKNLGHFVFYITNKYCFDNGYDALYYYGGCSRRENGKLEVMDKGLYEFKNTRFKNKIYYRRVEV